MLSKAHNVKMHMFRVLVRLMWVDSICVHICVYVCPVCMHVHVLVVYMCMHASIYACVLVRVILYMSMHACIDWVCVPLCARVSTCVHACMYMHGLSTFLPMSTCVFG
jgi:hypothetical protein